MPRTYLTLLIAACCCTAAVRAQSPSPTPQFITIGFPDADLTDVLRFYASLTNRKVWVELGLTQKVSVFTRRPIPQSEALAVLRGSLLQDGIQIREVGDTEAFVSRVTDSTVQDLRLPSPSPSFDLRAPIPTSPPAFATPTP